MKELEIKTYNFAIEGIGLAKSLENDLAGSDNELMKSAGEVSIQFMNAMNASENKDFAKHLKSCFSYTKRSLEILNGLSNGLDDRLNKQKNTLIGESKLIIEKLDLIIQKLIC